MSGEANMILDRYPKGTPLWKIELDLYELIAKQAEAQGKRFRAWRYKRKAERLFRAHGGVVIKT